MQDLADSSELYAQSKKMELNWSLADLQNKFGEHNPQVVSARAALAVRGQADKRRGGATSSAL